MSTVLESKSEFYELLGQEIIKGNFEKVERILNEQDEDKIFHDSILESTTVSLALTHSRFDIYELLISRGAFLGANVKVTELFGKMPYIERVRLREIHIKHFRSPSSNFVTTLLSKSKIANDFQSKRKPKLWNLVNEAYMELSKIKSIEPILKVVSQSEKLKIIFDFDRKSVEILDPTKTSNVIGTSYFHDGFIYVGAEGLTKTGSDRSNVNGTLAHELCHFALNMIYENFCNPYEWKDTQKIEYFKSVAEKCVKEKSFENVINIAFSYPEDKQHAELIVAVPNLIALNQNDSGRLEVLKEKYSSLFKFYENVTLVDLEKNCELLEVKREMKKLNELCGQISRLASSPIKIMSNTVKIDFNPEKITHFLSNCPKLTMKVIYDKHSREKHFELSYIFVRLSSLWNKNLFNSIVKAFNYCTKPKIIVDCDEENGEKIVKLLETFIEHGLDRRIVIVTNKIKLTFKADKFQVTHFWNHLFHSFQERLMKHFVILQGSPLPLEKIVDKSSMKTFESIPLNHLVTDKRILIGKEIAIPNVKFYVERKFLTQTENDQAIIIENNFDEVIAIVREEKIVLISGEPGMGKTTALKMFAKKLKQKFPSRWISFVDLKEHSTDFKKCRNESISFTDSFEIATFFGNKILKLKSFEAEVFILHFNSNRVNILLDGYDEIHSADRTVVLRIIKGVKETTKNQLWITTRSHLTQELKNILHSRTLKLKPLTKSDQKTLFQGYLKTYISDKKVRAKKLTEVDQFSNKLNLSSFNDFFSNPLQIIMIASIFKDDQSFDLSNSGLFRTYEIFVTQIVDRFMEKGLAAKNSITEFLVHSTSIIEIHQNLALNLLFKKGVIDPKTIGFNENILRIGFLYCDEVNSVKFVHRSFAEFFVANYISKYFFTTGEDGDVLKALIRILNSKNQFKMITIFLDSSLDTFEPVEEEKFRLSCLLLENVNDPKFLHELIKYQCLNLLKLLSVKTSEKSRKFWLEIDANGNNIFMNAARFLTIKEIEKFYSLALSMLDRESLKKMFLTSNRYGQNFIMLSLSNEDTEVFRFVLSVVQPYFIQNESLVPKFEENVISTKKRIRIIDDGPEDYLSDCFKVCKIDHKE